MPKYYTPKKAINFANSGTAAFDGIAQTVEKTALYTSDRQETQSQLGGVIKYRRDHREGLVSSLDFTKLYFHWSANDVFSNTTSFALTRVSTEFLTTHSFLLILSGHGLQITSQRSQQQQQ